MKLTGQFVGLKLDRNAYLARLKEQLIKELQRVARAWLGGVTGRVPIWSGMSQGALLELSELINGRLVIAPKSNIESRIPAGRSLGTAVPKYGPDEFTYTITTDVPHYNIQEYSKVARGGSPSAPWRSLLAGEAAFNAIASTISLPPLIFKPIIRKI